MPGAAAEVAALKFGGMQRLGGRAQGEAPCQPQAAWEGAEDSPPPPPQLRGWGSATSRCPRPVPRDPARPELL